MDIKEPLLSEWPGDCDGEIATNNIRKHEAPQKPSWKYIVAFTLLLVPIGWLCSYVAEFWLVVSRDRAMKHEQHSLNRGMWLSDEFEKITPSEKLQWHKCLEGRFKCARLTVPMDYNRPLHSCKDNPKVHIAMMMYSAAKSEATGKHSTSPLLLNPGGPGGSGVMFVAGLGPQMQQILPDQDIVSFDPRGIGLTTPQADCFTFPSPDSGGKPTPGDYEQGGFNRVAYMLMGRSIGIVNTSDIALKNLDARARTIGKLCQTNDAQYGNDSILRHLSTPAVAQDMLSMIDAWDAWRDESGQTSKAVVEREDESNPSTKGKLVYWGFSYGTLLGATFASMFPDRIGRVILDGVVDADYYVGPIWGDSLRDSDKVLASFYKYCHEGKELCALYRNGDNEDDIERRFNSILDDLKRNPITGINIVKNTPAMVTYSDIKSILFASLYFPIVIFPAIAQVLDIIHRGQGELLLNMLDQPFEFKPFCSAQYFPPGGDAQNAIMCSDKRYPLNETVSDLQARFERMSNVSTFADIWSSLMVGCDGYGIEATDPPMRWGRHPAHKHPPINTSYPLMFISNTADPVTPLFAGVKMARKFVGAGLIEQKSEGHCSMSTVSLCTLQKITDYFLYGKVPPAPKWGPDGGVEGGEWETCERDQHPFQQDKEPGVSTMSPEDVKLMEAWKNVPLTAALLSQKLEWFRQKLPQEWEHLLNAILLDPTLLHVNREEF